MAESIKSIFGTQAINSRIDFIHLSRAGISMKVLKKIQAYTMLTTKEIAEILPVSERQLLRYKEDHVLRKDISSHLIQLVELFERGYEILGKAKFEVWIRSEVRAIGGIKPIDIMDTSIGIQLVNDILGRIEHGVYS